MKNRVMDAVMIVLFVLLVGTMVYGGVRTLRPSAPFDYAANEFYPLDPVCPSRVLRWKSNYTFKMKEDFVTVQIARVVFDVQNGRVLGPDNQLDYYVWTGAERNIPIESVQKYELPDDLPPGQYQLRVGASASGTTDAGYVVPFVVPINCNAINIGTPKGD